MERQSLDCFNDNDTSTRETQSTMSVGISAASLNKSHIFDQYARNDTWGSRFLDGEIGNNGLTQRDAAIVTGHLPVGKNLETAVFQQVDCSSE